MQRMLLQIPVMLLAAIVAGISSDVGFLVGNELFEREHHETGANVFALARGLTMVESVFFVLGMLELARRFEGRARSLAKLAAGCHVVVSSWNLLSTVLQSMSSETVSDVLEHARYVTSLAVVVALACVIIAGHAWQRARVPMIVTSVCVLFRVSIPYVGTAIVDFLQRHDVVTEYFVVTGLASAASFAWLVASILRDTPEPRVDVERAERGFHRAAQSLYLRVIAAVAIAISCSARRAAEPKRSPRSSSFSSSVLPSSSYRS